MDKSAKIIVALVVIAVSGFFLYSKITGWHKAQLENAVKQEQEIWQDKTNKLESDITTLTEELTSAKGQKVPQEKLAMIFGETEKEELQKQLNGKAADQKPPNFPDIERRVTAFFLYLDDQPYVQSYKFPEGSYHQYQITSEKLSAKLPIVTGEMQSLYNMVRNVAHFYRVMGKKRVLLTKQILENESEVIESVMETFYQWFTMEDGGLTTLKGRPSMTSLYEYAGFILNTLGGRSYLLRRGPKVRTLSTYYCVLILNKANEEELNSKGIDIRPYIKSSLLEIKNQIGLIHQEKYITRLSELSMKYHSN